MIYEELFAAANFQPERLSFPDSWIGHIPFAAWLTKVVKPSVLVELGTHSGNSYLAFCQAVKEARLATRCYAIDTWKGDEQAGFYDENIFIELNEYHDRHYSKFSNLLRMTFDEAVNYFGDNTIDMLHIDGLHTYDAVKHDFKNWLPKLTSNAIVILHDINVHEREFGVWRFWQELCEQYPHNFEFTNSHGLGILQLSKPNNINEVLEWLRFDFPERQILRDYFSDLGQHALELFHNQEKIRYYSDQLAECNQNKQILISQVEDRDNLTKSLTTQVSENDEKNKKLLNQLSEYEVFSKMLTEKVKDQEQEIQTLSMHSAEQEQEIQTLSMHSAEQEQIILNMMEQIERENKTMQNLTLKFDQVRSELEVAKLELVEYALSTSWRITRPLRKIKDVICWVTRK